MKHGIRGAMGCSLVCAGLIGLTLLSARTAVAQTPEWQTYSYSTEGFSASFPAQPQEQKQNVDTAAGAFELRYYMVQAGQAVLMIAVSDFGSLIDGKDPDTVLQGGKNGALQNTSSHLVREKPIMMGANHGIEFESESDAAHFYARAYLTGGMLFQTVVISPVGSPYPDTLHFLDSFQLMARTKP